MTDLFSCGNPIFTLPKHSDKLCIPIQKWEFLCHTLYLKKYPFLLGPKGCGKSSVAKELADAMGMEYHAFNMGQAFKPKKMFVGSLIIGEDGKTLAVRSEFFRAFVSDRPTFHYYAKTSSSESNRRTQASAREFVHVIREVEAEAGTISGELLKKARELAAGIQLQLSMFSAKTDKNKVIYEQDAGELDEEELYQSRYNRNIFWEETPAPSARLEVVILLDLSGSMVTGDKIAMQTVLAVALVLAFERYANVVTYSVYGHRCDDNGIEVTCFHKPGRRLQLAKLFSQKALYANADGYAMQYCFEKFQPDSPHKLFLMISDGTPSVVASEGEDPQEQVREVVHEGKKKRIEVLSLGIDNFDQADMYDEFIPYSGADTIVLFSRWLRKKFSSLADETVF